MSTKQPHRKHEAEYGVDSRYKNVSEKKKDAFELMQARLKRMKQLSPKQIREAKLLQLKLRVENYLKNPGL
ncbi:MAG: hypothetical protein U0T73_01980 [Chitinophagales bacterium]